jgi:hypothetical protein
MHAKKILKWASGASGNPPSTVWSSVICTMAAEDREALFFWIPRRT